MAIESDTLNITIFAAEDRNSQKCCNWLAEEGLQVAFCADIDQLMSRTQDTPNVRLTLIVDTEIINDSDALLRNIDRYHRYYSRFLVIFLVGRGQKNNFLNSLPTIQFAVLAKPFTREQLVSTLRLENSPDVDRARRPGRGRQDKSAKDTLELSSCSTGSTHHFLV